MEALEQSMWEILEQIFHNFSLILIMFLCYNITRVYFVKLYQRHEALIAGVGFGLIGLLSMLYTIELIDGVLIDGRNAIIGIAAFFWGPVAGFISAAIVGVVRFLMGGYGATSGLMSAFVSAACGLVFYYYKDRFKSVYRALGLMSLVMFALVVVPVLMLPRDLWWISLSTFFLPTLIIYPFGILLYGSTVIVLNSYYQNEEKMKSMNEALEHIVRERTQALIEANEGLTKEIEQRIEAEHELEAAVEQAKVASRTKGEFLANMSHEIRTPLNAILGYAHLIGETDLNGQQRNYLDKMASASDQLLTIVNDILDYSKIEAGHFDISSEPINLYALIGKLSDTLTIDVVRKELLFEVVVDEHVPEWVIGDEGHTSQILLNVLSNAVKFTSIGHVRLHIGIERLNYHLDQLNIEVTDTGIGVRQDHLDLIFHAFTQANSSINREYGGTGLGLAITKYLVEHLGGQIHMESTYEKGTRVRLQLPVEKAYQKVYRFNGLNRIGILTTREGVFKQLSQQLKGMDAHIQGLTSLNDLHPQDHLDYLLIDWQQKIAPFDLLLEVIKERCQVTKRIIMVAYERHPAIQHYMKQQEHLRWLFLPCKTQDLLHHLSDHEKDTYIDVSHAILAGKKILLVEDNLLNQEIEKQILEGWELEVAVANDGQEALEMVEKEAYDLILMDLHMPVMDGFKASREIRRIEPDFIPILAMTADTFSGVEEKINASGMNGYIAKPIKVDDLYQTLVKWL